MQKVQLLRRIQPILIVTFPMILLFSIVFVPKNHFYTHIPTVCSKAPVIIHRIRFDCDKTPIIALIQGYLKKNKEPSSAIRRICSLVFFKYDFDLIQLLKSGLGLTTNTAHRPC